MTDFDDDLDGRHRRRQRNREAVVDALLELYGEGNLEPSANEVAERAGSSPRSLFRYFDDVDDLCGEAIRRQEQRVRGLVEIGVGTDAPAAERIAALVESRVALFEA
ncbi:MAG: TetR family transcriptional regulator, partial [Acidobacteria bacterium]|nr:TetR family transcriptional regulator [Acidobacteriota bacterium]